jgi:hypothetical protein
MSGENLKLHGEDAAKTINAEHLDETVIDAEVEEVDTTPEQFRATLDATAQFFNANTNIFNSKLSRAHHALEVWRESDPESKLGLAAKLVVDTVFTDLVNTSDALQSLAEKAANVDNEE